MMQSPSCHIDRRHSGISDHKRSVPIVYLSEKSLERLHEKLKRSSSTFTEKVACHDSDSALTERKKRQPKQQFYQAGRGHTQLANKVKDEKVINSRMTPKESKSEKLLRTPPKSRQKKSMASSKIADCKTLTKDETLSTPRTEKSINKIDNSNLESMNNDSSCKTTGGKRYNNISRLPVEEIYSAKDENINASLDTTKDIIEIPSQNYLLASSPVKSNGRSPSRRQLIHFDSDYTRSRSQSIGSNMDDYNRSSFMYDNRMNTKQSLGRRRQLSESSDVVSRQSVEQLNSQTVTTLGRYANDVESRLENLLDKLDCADENLAKKRLFEEREHLKLIYKCILLKDVEYASKNGVDNQLWKNIFYQLVEKLRGQLEFSYDDERENIKSVLIDVFEAGNTFYKELLVDLQKMYEFSLEDVPLDPNVVETKRKSHLKKIKLAVMICQKIFLCLGDLARYRESTKESTEFGSARKWYLSAKKVEPRNGRPYNQLALLAVLTKRRLDAVYYYIRSLGAGNPVLTAKESLLALFNDIRRKKEYLQQREKKQSSSTNNSVSGGDNAKGNIHEFRDLPREEWVLPHIYSSVQQDFDKLATSPEDTNSNVAQLEGKPNENLQQLPKKSTTVNTSTLKEFILSFLNLNGIIFTRIAFDLFEDQMSHVIGLFSSILQSAKGMPEKTAFCLLTVVFFTVHDQHEKSKGDLYNNLFLTRSVELTFAMITCITKKVVSIFEAIGVSHRREKLNSESSMWISMLKISCDWLYTNKKIWTGHDNFTHFHNIYELTNNLAQVLNLLHTSFYISSVDHDFKKVDNHSEYMQCELVKVELPEDDEFKGFSPLSHFEDGPHYLLKFESYCAEMKQDACNYIRCNIIYEFLQYLCGIDFPLIAFKGGQYITLVPKVVEIENVFSGNRDHTGCNSGGGGGDKSMSPPSKFDHHRVKQDFVDDQSLGDQYHNENDLNDLKQYHNALQQTKQYQDKRQQLIQISLNNANDTLSNRAVVKVCPQFLVPDTNCFIDHLNLIHKILERSDYYVVCVPLIVFIELKGLATHSKSSNSHAISVKDSAKAAFDFLSDVFGTRKNHEFRIKALTNQGTKLETFSFLSQEVESAGNNDDFILQCCVKHEEKQSKISSNSNVLTTVLLTDDRNLRVKALTKNTPAKSLPAFCRWTMI